MDIAIKDGFIASKASDIPAEQGTLKIDATGLYVAPGFIDIHRHVFHGPSGRIIA